MWFPCKAQQCAKLCITVIRYYFCVDLQPPVRERPVTRSASRAASLHSLSDASSDSLNHSPGKMLLFTFKVKIVRKRPTLHIRWSLSLHIHLIFSLNRVNGHQVESQQLVDDVSRWCKQSGFQWGGNKAFHVASPGWSGIIQHPKSHRLCQDDSWIQVPPMAS